MSWWFCRWFYSVLLGSIDASDGRVGSLQAGPLVIHPIFYFFGNQIYGTMFKLIGEEMVPYEHSELQKWALSFPSILPLLPFAPDRADPSPSLSARLVQGCSLDRSVPLRQKGAWDCLVSFHSIALFGLDK
jgi:hypothetical protein